MLRHPSLPIWLALAAALWWGVWWMPVRYLEGFGLPGIWAGVAMIAGAIPVLIVSLLFKRKPGRLTLRAILGGCGAAAAMTLYSAAITETTVVRAVLLFYLAPGWAIAIECLFMDRKFRWFNAVALALAALGVVVIFGGKIDFAGWNTGDTMALISGVAWAAGSSLIFTGPVHSLRKLSLVTCVAALIIGSLIAVLLGQGPPSVQTSVAFPTLASGTFYIAPMLIATLWSAQRLNPATLSFLLTAEIISGLSSSALFLSEPFGLYEIAGACLITSAALIEVVIPAQTRSAEH